jgi:cell shape-determining protein MreC
MNPELNPRQKQIEKLTKELAKAAKSKKFIESEEGNYVLDYIGELISNFTNQMINTRKTHEEYIELRAKIDVLRKLRGVLEVQSSDQAISQLNEQLDLASSGE